MQNHRKLSLILSGSVLVFGIIGCSPNQPGHSREPFTLGEPKIRRVDRSEVRIVENVPTTSNPLPPATTGDQIVFAANDVSSNDISLTSTTHCNVDGGDTQVVRRNWMLKESFKLYEFLPIETLFDRHDVLTKKINCRFNFVATRSDGATHSFNFNFGEIIFADGDLHVFKNGEHIGSTALTPVSLARGNFLSYDLPLLQHGDDTYLMNCEHSTGIATASPFSIRFDHFKITLKNEGEKYDGELCRIFALDGLKRPLAISDIVKLNDSLPDVRIEKIFDESPDLYNQKSTFEEGNPTFLSTYRVTNLSGRSISIVVPAGAAQLISATLIFEAPGQYLWRPAEFQTQSSISLPASLPIRRFSNPTPVDAKINLKTAESREFTFGLRMRAPNCGGPGELVAARYSPKSPLGFVLYVVQNPDQPIDAKNILQTFVIEPPFEKWIKSQFHGIVNVGVVRAGWGSVAPLPLELTEKNKKPESCY